MLNNLTISDFAIIEKTEINFRAGLNILTGETGAGKSILIDAIALINGGRADISAIRNGAQKANISAEFSDIPVNLQNFLSEQELQNVDSPDEVIIRRTLRDKSSKAFVNSLASTTAQIREIAEDLINIHGQNASQTLLTSEGQRERLDRAAKNEEILAKTAKNFHLLQKKRREFALLQEVEKADRERAELLDYQLEELEQLAPEVGEFSVLSARHRELSNAEEILQEGGNLAYGLLEAETNPAQMLKSFVQMANKLTKKSPQFQDAAELLSQSAVYIEEAADSLQRALSVFEENPEEFAKIDARMSELHRLANKHRIAPDELAEKFQELTAEREVLAGRKQQSEELVVEISKLEEEYKKIAAELSKLRQEESKKLASRVEKLIRGLGMEKAVFAIKVSPTERQSAQGIDEIDFQLCANPGQNLQSIAKIASGGELSRISLAIEVASLSLEREEYIEDDGDKNNEKDGKKIQKITEKNIVKGKKKITEQSSKNPPHTIIFDEIDAGIGGETADTVGKLLAELAKYHQVLCITHLPQVASYADCHFRIEKFSDDNSTQTSVRELSREEKISEIARMLGDSNSETSQKHALEMLNRAEEIKK